MCTSARGIPSCQVFIQAYLARTSFGQSTGVLIVNTAATTIVDILGLYRNNGKEHGNYYTRLGDIGIMEKNMETA